MRTGAENKYSRKPKILVDIFVFIRETTCMHYHRLTKIYFAHFIILPVILMFFIVSCSEKFKVAAPYKNITVVYGLMDMADTAHYIRIQKAFLDQEKSALAMAQTPDSSFYAHLNVRIERFNFSNQSIWLDTIHLNRVDLKLEGYQKQPGVFFTAPNYAYKFTNRLDPGYIYRLVVTNPATGETDSADAPVINDKNDTSFYVDLLDAPWIQLDFHAIMSEKPFVIGGYYSNLVSNFNFQGQLSPATAATATIRFNWIDSNNLTKELTKHFFDRDLGFYAFTNQFGFKMLNIDFYAALSEGMGQAPPNIYRLLERCDITVALGTSDFYNYYQSSLTAGTGLTGEAIEPINTNIKGNSALGLFTSRGIRTGKATINQVTVDSLMASTFLAQTRIAGTSYQ
jgi:hypothetical protein